MAINSYSYMLFVLIGITVAIVPGPSIFLLVSQNANFGFKKAMPVTAGLMLGTVLCGILTLFGAGFFILNEPKILFTLKIIGAILLLMMGLNMIFKSRSATIEISKTGTTPYLQFFSGIVTTVTNPKILTFYLLFIPQFVNKKVPLSKQISILILLVLTQIIIKAVILLGYSIASSRFGKSLLNGRTSRIVMRISGLLLIGASFSYIYMN